MKKINRFTKAFLRFGIPALMVGIAATFSSCTKDAEVNKPAPTVSVTPASTSNLPGAAVTSSVQVDAPEGGSTLTILVNGTANSALPNVALNGSASQAVPLNFTIPATAAIGATYVVTVQAADKKNQLSNVGVFAITVSSVASKVIVDVPAGNITTPTTWTADKIWRLNGFVRVGTDNGTADNVITASTTLTIEAGTVIYGKTGTPGGTLIIQRGSKLIANGTAAKPIIFTSEKAIGTRKAGDWGGVVLCGKAKINNPTSAGNFYNQLEGGYGGWYGGGTTTDDADNSGSLKYVRIEFAGYPINPNQEINGLTLGGVGNGTTMQFIQVTYSNDDSFEWFGGSVTASNLIAYKGIDDDFDTDNGFSGKVQFGLGIRDALISDQSGSNGFEADNDGSGTANQPYTSAVFSNMTIIGPKSSSGLTIGTQFQNIAHLRRNVREKIINSFFTGYPTGIFIDNTLTAGDGNNAVINATNGDLVLKNNVLAGVTGWGSNGFGSAIPANGAAAAESAISGLPFFSSGTTPVGNAAAPPRGRIVAAGQTQLPTGGSGTPSNPFQNGVFTITDFQIAGQDALPWFTTTNTVLKSYADAGINSNAFEPLNGVPTLIPSGAVLSTGADFTGFTGFTTVAYKGAFGSTDWTTGWVNWNPQITDYSK